MPNVIIFRANAELDALANLEGFIDSCRTKLTVFGTELAFDENVWDVTEWLELKGHGNKRHRLVFSSFASVNDAKIIPMGEPFLSFAKSYVRYMQGLRPTKIIAFRLTALRALEMVLTENGGFPDVVRTDMFTLNRAAQIVKDKYKDATAYRIGGQLEMLAAFLAENRLTTVPVIWRNYLKRPGDAVRVGKQFDERRMDKLPTEAVLDALPKVFRLAVDPGDVIISSVAAILCSAPDRINEALLLSEQCEVHQKYGKDQNQVYGLRWWPAKGADPMVKWIVPSMASVVQEAIGQIRRVTDAARKLAKWYENHPKQIYLDTALEHLRGKEWISMQDVGQILGLPGSNAPGCWIKSKGLEKWIKGRFAFVRFSDVQDAVVSMLPAGFPVLNQETGLKYSDALFVVRINELHNRKGTYPCMIEPVTINQINTGLGTRVQHGFSSVFTRLGFSEPDGSPIKVTTHQFRHYLNTLAQAGGMSQLDIAKWSGRKDIRQNAAYDHVTTDQILLKIRDAIGDKSKMFGPLAEIPKKVLILRDEFARLRVPTAHTTDLGYCIHDYTMSPCQLHRDCIHCDDLVCIKGDEEKTKRIRQSLKEARALLANAEDAVGNGYAGSNPWLDHHMSTVERLSQLCLIMDDPNVPHGSVVQLAPPRRTIEVEDTSNARLPAAESKSIPAGLLADVKSSKRG